MSLLFLLQLHRSWNSISVRFDNYLYCSDTNVSYFNFRYEAYSTDEDHRNFQIDNTSVIAAARLTGTEFSVVQGDVVVIEDLKTNITGWLGGASNKINRYAWAVAYFNEETSSKMPFTVFLRSGWRNLNISGETFWSISAPKGTTLSVGASHARCAVILLLDVTLKTEATLSMNNANFTVSYGNPNSTIRPKYTSPDTDQVDVYYSAEQELLSSGQVGRDEVEGVFSNMKLHITRLSGALYGANKVFDIFFTEFTFWNTLVLISLGLGIYIFLLGVAPSFIGAFSERRDPPPPEHHNYFFVWLDKKRR